jgi:hypothetical protein
MSDMSEDPLIVKFRSLFPDKSRKELKVIFVDMTKSVYKNTGKDEKMSDGARNRWGPVAASLRSLNLIEFKIAMYRFKHAGLTFEEIRRVFIHLDTSGNGRVEYDEFLVGIRGELSMFRQRLVIYIFRKLDRNSSGYIEESELANYYASSNLVEIIDGTYRFLIHDKLLIVHTLLSPTLLFIVFKIFNIKIPPNDSLYLIFNVSLIGTIAPKEKSKELILNVGTAAPNGTNQEGRISVSQFIDYYLSMSLLFQGNDDEFRTEVLSEWRVESEQSDSPLQSTAPPPKPGD